MQVCEYREPTVRRDMELIRQLLINIEAERRFDGTRWWQIKSPEDLGVGAYSDEEVGYHLNLLIDAGLVKGKGGIETIPNINKLTWQGHEFVDNIKNNDVWSKVKTRLAGLQSVALSVVVALAESEVKQKLGLH
jgi:Hypothetical protein (DUF2513)